VWIFHGSQERHIIVTREYQTRYAKGSESRPRTGVAQVSRHQGRLVDSSPRPHEVPLDALETFVKSKLMINGGSRLEFMINLTNNVKP
jgi:hypothetical protein